MNNHQIHNNIFSKAGTPANWYSFRAAADNKSADIRIDGEIGGWGMTARQLVSQIKALDEDATINIRIFSPGGSVFDGNEMYNALKEHKGTVNVVIGALCASIATVIACAGDSIKMVKNGLFMVHNPTTFCYGEAEEFEQLAKTLRKVKATIIETYKARSSKSEKDLSAMMDDTTWMDSDEAKESGFIDEILDEEDPEADNIKDRFDLTTLKNSAKALSKLQKKSEPESNDDKTKVRNNSKSEPPPVEKPPETDNAIQTLIENYRMGKTTLFNSILSGSIAKRISNNSATTDPEEIKKQAKALYAEKLKRDEEIDNIVIRVREKDKKDFSKLAAKFKKEDKTAQEFAMAIAGSEDFTPTPVISGEGGDLTNQQQGKERASGQIQVVGIMGVPKGSLGDVFVSSDPYKAFRDKVALGRHEHTSASAEANQFALLISGFLASTVGSGLGIQNATTTTAGLTSIEKLPGVVGMAVRPLRVKDLIAPGSTNNTTIRYIRETVFANAAAVTAEGAAKPEQSFTLVETDANVRKIAAWTKMSEETMKDYPAVASFINMRMPYLIERTEEDELLNGDGTGQHLTGILQTAGIQTQAVAADTDVDAIYKAMTKVRWANMASAAGGFEPDGIIMHPNDWEEIRLAKDANEQYYGGGPFTGAYGNGMGIQFDILWGKPVAITPAITEGTALVGAFRMGSQYFQREGVTIESTNTDQDDFIKNLVTIRAESRLALAVYRPTAFCTVTGLNA